MLYVLEQLPSGEPRVWFAFDLDDLLGKTAGRCALEPWEVWDERSPRELLALFDTAPEAPQARERFPGICALGIEHGWERALYRADALLGPGLYTHEPITVLAACEAALRRHGLLRLWPEEAAALRAFEDDGEALWQGPGWKARWALREQLVATDVVADA